MSAVREPVAGAGDCAVLSGLVPVELPGASKREKPSYSVVWQPLVAVKASPETEAK